MKIGKILLGALGVLAVGNALYSVYGIKKGKVFEKGLDRSVGSLDEAVICGGKLKVHSGKEMRDLDVGAFFGGMQIDLCDVITKEKDYHMNAEIINGGINVIVPPNFNISLVDICHFGGVANNTICEDPENAVNLSVFAEVTCGGLNFENPTLELEVKPLLLEED